MKIIFSRGLGYSPARLVVFRNGQRIRICSVKKDYCVFDAQEGDQIIVELKYLGIPTLPIASFVCRGENDTFSVGPTAMCKRWEMANLRIFPWFCALFLLLKILVRSDTHEWLFAGMLAFTILSLVCFQVCMSIPFMLKRLFSGGFTA